ncbi:hydrogen peroxide-dependent heme synthase [Paucisalibacillus globulus]|uniref:hydrogen peroxide-dependent heme synthase n=1 Tax=Paucisalibacillus globulus TaxID=351095 RepID=UPI000BB67A37|nr:hydrogen peroxide-dependent heme synthase [Paucisalibacillus globulus]
MSNAPKTLEGWYCLNDFRKIKWEIWNEISVQLRREILEELLEVCKQWKVVEDEKTGSHAIFQILGHKADFLFMFLRPNLEELAQAELAINKTRFAKFTTQSTSYVSVVELTNYLPEGKDPYSDTKIRERLYPQIPKTNNICFYPMNKLRIGNDNWYMLTPDERNQMMKSHRIIGRSYNGKVRQIILSSVGLDDYEWGVALFADDPIDFKKLIYEMRFDEVSARFAEFGTFYIGSYLGEEQLTRLLNL